MVWTASELLEPLPDGTTRGFDKDGKFKGWDELGELDSDDDYDLHPDVLDSDEDYDLHPDVLMWCEEEKRAQLSTKQLELCSHRLLGDSQEKKKNANVLMTESEKEAFMNRFVRKAKAAIRRAGHTDRKKPYTTLVEPIPLQHILALLGDHGRVVSHTKNFMTLKYVLRGEEVSEWLGIEPLIEKVLFTGPIVCLSDRPVPRTYRDAEFESLGIRCTSNGLTTFKFRTFLPATYSAGENALWREGLEVMFAHIDSMKK